MCVHVYVHVCVHVCVCVCGLPMGPCGPPFSVPGKRPRFVGSPLRSAPLASSHAPCVSWPTSVPVSRAAQRLGLRGLPNVRQVSVWSHFGHAAPLLSPLVFALRAVCGCCLTSPIYVFDVNPRVQWCLGGSSSPQPMTVLHCSFPHQRLLPALSLPALSPCPLSLPSLPALSLPALPLSLSLSLSLFPSLSLSVSHLPLCCPPSCTV